MYISYRKTFVLGCIAALLALGTFVARFYLFDSFEMRSYYGITLQLIGFSASLIGFGHFFIGLYPKEKGRSYDMIGINLLIGLLDLVYGLLALISAAEKMDPARTGLIRFFFLLTASAICLFMSAGIKKRKSTTA